MPRRSVVDLPPSSIRMMFNEAAGKDDVVHLSIGQPDFNTPAPVIEAMVQALHEGKTRYALDSGVPEFREAIGGYYERTQGVQVHPEEILVTDGAVEAITLTLQAFISPGDEVILLEPAFVVYAPFIRMIGGEPVSVVTRVEDGYIPDPNQVEAAVTPRTRMILVNSPCNPTGSTYPVEVLQGLAAVARRHGLLLGSDEVYEQLVYDHEGSYPSMLALEPDRDRLFVFHSLSKTYAMTGIRVGWVVTGHSNWRLLQKLHTFTTTVANTPGQWAGIEALTGDQTFIPPMVSEYRERRNLALDLLRDIPHLSSYTPGGAFYIFPRFDLDLDADTFCLRLLEEARVCCIPGTGFGESCRRAFRISYAVGPDTIREGLRRIRQWLTRF
jgi:aminotransferase